MGDQVRIADMENPKERRAAEEELIGRYHEQELRALLERVREGVRQLDASQIDPSNLMTSSTTTNARHRSSGASATQAGRVERTPPVCSNGTESTTRRTQTGGSSAGRVAEGASRAVAACQRPGGSGMLSCRQIPRAVGVLISRCRGTVDRSPVAGFSHSSWFAASRRSRQP